MTAALDQLDTRRTLASEIIAASPTMPDPNAHLLWLLCLPEARLRQRLETIQRESCQSHRMARVLAWTLTGACTRGRRP